MSRRVLERIISGLKGNASYRLDPELSDTQLATVLWHRAWQLVRGLSLRVSARGVRGTVFRGRNVAIRHRGQLKAGPGLILEDFVLIDALSHAGITLGRNVTIARGSTLLCTGVIAQLGQGISIGDRCAVGAGSFLGGQGGVQIGDDVIMGPAVRILSENHVFDDAAQTIRSQGVRRAGITIGSDCWIGAGAVILDGVHVAAGCVVGAGSVITRDTPPNSVLVGAPARVIRTRDARADVDAPQASLPSAMGIPAKSRS